MNKRGQIETQFNWIFVLIVGAVIMVFFTTIVLRQKVVSEQKLSATVISDLETIFTGASVSKGTTHLLNVPKVDMEFDCNRFYLKNVNKPLGKQVVFAPSRVKGTRLLTWTLEWNMPFKVTNFLYITSLEMRYIFVYDSSNMDLVEKINSSLPEDMNVEFYEYNGNLDFINDRNNYKVRVIFVGDFGDYSKVMKKIKEPAYFPSKLSKMEGEDLTALLITKDRAGEYVLYFYKKAPTSNEFEFVNVNAVDSTSKFLDYVLTEDSEENFPSLFGAIFTDDSEAYNCVMRKAFERLNLVATVYEDKASHLWEFYDGKPDKLFCKRSTEDVLDEISTGIIGESEDCSQPDGFPDKDKCKTQDILNVATDIHEKNKGLLLYSCALIY